MSSSKLAFRLILMTPLLFAGSFLRIADEQEEQAGLVEATPEVLTCQQLIEQPTPENRHLKITNCWLGPTGVSLEERRTSQEIYLLVPLYPDHVKEEDQGQQIRLLARITGASSEQELDALYERTDQTGFIWDDLHMGADVSAEMRDIFPQLDAAKCRIVNIGQPLPTPGRAQLYRLAGYAAFAFAGAVVIWTVVELILRWAGLIARPEDRDAFQPDAAPRHAPPPSTTAIALQDWAVQAGPMLRPAGVVGALAFFFLLRADLVTPTIGSIGMWTCGGLILFGRALTLLVFGRYREYDQKLMSEAELPGSARRFYQQQTAKLARLGFEQLADIQLTSEVGQHYLRMLLSQDGKSLAQLESGFGKSACTFLSITSDGVCLETSSLDTTTLNNATLPKLRQSFQGTPEETSFAHEDFVNDYAREQDVSLLEIEADQIPALLDYEHRITAWSLYKSRLFSKMPPPIPVFESLNQLKALRDERLGRSETRLMPV